MKLSRFFTALLALIILACSFGVQGQYTTTQSQTTSSIATSGMYSQNTQYYNMAGSAQMVHIGASVPFDITGKTPSNVYLGSQNQAMPYSQYMSSANAGANTLWIQGATNWTQYVTVPQGASVTLIAISPAGGNGYLDEIADGLMYNFDQAFYPSSQITFYANTVGLHTLYFMLKGQPSNQVTIFVTGNTNYQPSYYPYQYYPGYYSNYYPGYYPGYHPRYYRDYSQGIMYSFDYSSY